MGIEEGARIFPVVGAEDFAANMMRDVNTQVSVHKDERKVVVGQLSNKVHRISV